MSSATVKMVLSYTIGVLNCYFEAIHCILKMCQGKDILSIYTYVYIYVTSQFGMHPNPDRDKS